jgi:hypothetical protein
MAAAIIILGAAILTATTTQVSATAVYSQQTGRPCGTCHQNPAGSGPLKPFGQRFKDNGYKIK